MKLRQKWNYGTEKEFGIHREYFGTKSKKFRREKEKHERKDY